ncbi:MAG TPA: alpha/beta hydrolase-fold protein [Rhodanobacteraceae bacterium]|nr:alpha/beta hydrolase-fold protein [Rhodanobacteraceae bacterium]
MEDVRLTATQRLRRWALRAVILLLVACASVRSPEPAATSAVAAAAKPDAAAGDTVAHGHVVKQTIHSPALAGNAIGDTPDREVTIYLPPSYDHAPDKRYPVVYLLHGATSDPKEWFDGTYQGMDLGAALDRLAGQKEFIVVMPAADNRFGGTFYVNSRAFGRWEDFITQELVGYIDAHYRTLPTRQSRGLAGQSMGGFGALYLAGRHADTFGHVYATSPCCLALVGDLAMDSARWQHDPGGWLRAMGMAFAPASQADIATATPPLPFVAGADGHMHDVPAVIAQWNRYLPLSRLTRDPSPYRRLCSIALDAGRQDQIPSVPLGAAAFSRELTRDGIANTFVEFEGTHTDHARERFETAMMPFFARVLATPGQAGACPGR